MFAAVLGPGRAGPGKNPPRLAEQTGRHEHGHGHENHHGTRLRLLHATQLGSSTRKKACSPSCAYMPVSVSVHVHVRSGRATLETCGLYCLAQVPFPGWVSYPKLAPKSLEPPPDRLSRNAQSRASLTSSSTTSASPASTSRRHHHHARSPCHSRRACPSPVLRHCCCLCFVPAALPLTPTFAAPTHRDLVLASTPAFIQHPLAIRRLAPSSLVDALLRRLCFPSLRASPATCRAAFVAPSRHSSAHLLNVDSAFAAGSLPAVSAC